MEDPRLMPCEESAQAQTSEKAATRDSASSQLPSFEYTPLPPGCIRLLSPDPEAESPGLAWRLQTVRLDEKPEFDALSYVWGSQAALHSILVNSRTYNVHPNLHSAMPYLATRCRQEFPIWIDAICINQEDRNEVAAQVTLMHQVYRGARMVWVWLGKGRSKVRTGMSEAVTLLAKINCAAEESSEASSKFARKDEDDMNPLVVKSNVWAAVSHLLSNDWYHRVWVMQEAALAKDLIFLCGKHEVSGETIRAALHNIRASSLTDEEGSKILITREMISATGPFHVRRIVQRPHKQRGRTLPNDSTLMRLSYFMVAKRTKCLLAEDRIWGLMGLSTSISLDQELRQGSDTDDLYTRFSRYVLSANDPNDESLAWWRWFRLPFLAEFTNTLPSWVPNFHQAASRETSLDAICHYLTNDSVFNGEGKPQASRRSTKFYLGEQTNEILLFGKRVDEVKEVLDGTRRNMPRNNSIPPYSRLTPFQALDHLRILADWLNMVELHLNKWALMRIQDPVRDDQPMHQDTWWNIILMAKNGSNIEDFHNVRSKLRRSKEMAAKYGIGESSMQDTDAEHTKSLYHAREVLELSLFQQKRLFWTKSGKFGFTSRGVTPGDSVCVFDGAEYPHVLRKADTLEDGKERWRFVGDAFVDGLMYGQADDIDIEGKQFCIV